MASQKIMYLVRGGGGKMRTIMATSESAAVKAFLAKYPASPGDAISVKERGKGDWEEYVVR
jgi:hypothetical protein